MTKDGPAEAARVCRQRQTARSGGEGAKRARARRRVASTDFPLGFQQLQALSGSHYDKDHSILGSILGPLVYGNPPL